MKKRKKKRFLNKNDSKFFSIFSDAEIKHNCDRATFENIIKIYNNHEQHKIKSPLTQAAYIIPLNDLNFKPWTKDGFTFTTWLRLNSDLGASNQSNDPQYESVYSPSDAANVNEVEKTDICSQHCMCKNKQHFISIGTNSLILSIYLCVTNVNTMYFQITNLNAHHQKSLSKSHSENFRRVDANMVNGTKKTKCTCATVKKRRNTKRDSTLHHEMRHNRRARSKDNQSKESPDDSSSASNVLTATRMALKSSLSHFNLFSSNRNSDKDTDANAIGYPVEIKGVKMYKNRWTLLNLAACYTGNEIQLQIIVDNSPVIEIKLPCANLQSDSKKEKINIFCIGHKYSPPSNTRSPTKTKDFIPLETIPDSTAQTEVESHTFRYSLSNVLLFRRRTLNREILANLYALGPDCINFAQCQVNTQNRFKSLKL